MARVANFSAGEIAGRKSPGGAVGRTPFHSSVSMQLTNENYWIDHVTHFTSGKQRWVVKPAKFAMFFL